MAPLGYSFTPGMSNRFVNSANAGLPGVSNGSQALQVLSLQTPDYFQGHPPAPDALLRGSIGGFTPDAAVRAQVSGTPALFGGIGAPPPFSMPSSGSPFSISTPQMAALLNSILFSGNPSQSATPGQGTPSFVFRSRLPLSTTSAPPASSNAPASYPSLSQIGGGASSSAAPSSSPLPLGQIGGGGASAPAASSSSSPLFGQIGGGASAPDASSSSSPLMGQIGGSVPTSSNPMFSQIGGGSANTGVPDFASLFSSLFGG